MPVDAEIPLAAGNIQGETPQQQSSGLISMFSLAQAVKQAQTQQTRVNALRDAFTNPNSIDPNTGLPTNDAVRKIMQVDPELGVKIKDDAMNAQVKRAQIEHYKTEAGKSNFDFMSSAAGIGYNAYDAAKKAGKSEADAITAGQAARNEAVKNNGGVISDDMADGIIGKPFEPQSALALANSNTEFARSRSEASATARQEKAEGERERHDTAMEADTRRGQDIHIETAGANKWVVQHDPKTNTDYRYNPETAQATTLDGKPYTPQGAAKETSGQARSAAALAAQRYVQEHPDATAEDVAQFAADFGKTVKSVGAFSTGKQGDTVRSFNVAISHLNTLDGLVDALGNGDVQMLNKAGQAFKQQFGSAAPTNFDAAKAIVGDEIVKAIVGGGGALADRENAQNQINRAESPQQLKSVIKTYKELMGGQLKGLKKQYEDTTGRKDFDERLSPETKKELGIGGGGGQKIAAPTSKSEYDALPSGAHYSKPGDAPGTYRVKQ